MRAYLDAYRDYDDAAQQFGDEVEEYPEEIRPKRPRQPAWLSLYLQCKQFHMLPCRGRALRSAGGTVAAATVAAGDMYERWLQERQSEQQAEAVTMSSFGDPWDDDERGNV